MKIGIMGGTFDPVHDGHLTLARTALSQYDLDEIWFLPNGNPPHKQNVCNEEHLRHRVRMVELAIRPFPDFRLCMYEADKREVSYSYATMEHFCTVYPKHRFYFIIGADSLASLEEWKYPKRLLKICTVLAACRDDIDNQKTASLIRALNAKYGADIRLLLAPKMPVSSHEIRALRSHGMPVDAFLPSQVDSYIRTYKLYQGDEHGTGCI